MEEYCPNRKNNTNINNLVSPFYSKSKNIIYDSNQNSTLKNVFKKPVVKKNRLYITKQKLHTNSCTINQSLNFSKIQKLYKNRNNNHNIIINTHNRNIVKINNETSLNESHSDNKTNNIKIDNITNNNGKNNDNGHHSNSNDKIAKNNNINNINNKNENNKDNIDNNGINDNFYTLNNEKRNKNSNLMSLKNKNIIHRRKKTGEINKICLKNNNNININILEKMNNSKLKKSDSININSINLISNNNINKINHPSYLSKLFSLSNTISHDSNNNNNYPEAMNTDYAIKTQKSNKKSIKRFFFNETKSDINRTNEEHLQSNYYSSITEANPNSLMEEIELIGLNLNKNKNGDINCNNKFRKMNYLEAKKNILISIENEKQKIIDESFKNYRKYLYLIQKQQQEYEEYDQYLKHELNNNLNNQRKLKLFKEKLKLDSTNISYYNLLKNKKILMHRAGVSPTDNNNTLSSKNIENKYPIDIMKKIITPNTTNTINTIIYDDQRFFTTTTSDPLYSEDNESNNKFSMKSYNNNTNSNNHIEKPLKYLNKKILKINIEDIKKFKKINLNNKNKKNDNKIKNKTISNHNFDKHKKNISKFTLNCFSSDKPRKTNKKINTEIFNTINNFKNNNELEIYLNNHKHKLSTNNLKKKLILKKLMKNIKAQKKPKLDYTIIQKKPISNSNNATKKCKSLRKFDNYNDCIDSNPKSNISSVNSKELHKMISEEKKKVLNRFNNLFKNKENINSNNNEDHSKNNYNLNINEMKDDKNINNDKMKNGLYYSAFKINKIEPNF